MDITEDVLSNSPEWIINRVFDRGTLDEVIWVINNYGFDFVKQSLITTTITCPITPYSWREPFSNYNTPILNAQKGSHFNYTIRNAWRFNGDENH